MHMNLTRRSLIKGTVAGLALSGASRLSAETPLKVGFVYSSPINDNGWSYRHEVGRLELIEEFGGAIETSFVESVAQGSDASRVMTSMALSGHKLIFSCSFGFMDPTIETAARFPDVFFENNTGYKTAQNVSTYNARFHQGRTVFGTMAAMMSRTGVVGYIASYPIAEVIMGINAFTLAARKVRPDIQVRVIWLYTWYNPALEADAAQALMEQGADIITQHTNSPAPCQVAESLEAMCFGQDADMSAFAPAAHLTGIVNNWGPYYSRRVRDVLNGTWTSQSSWDGMAEGVVKMAPYNPALPPDVLAAAQDVEARLTSGQLDSFEGPIKNAQGESVINAGEVLSDAQLHSMQWFVEGVQAEIPS